MPIQVVCPGCQARFQVSSKFAGKKGPCPKCKQIIRVPDAAAQVIIHAPEHSEAGARDAKGRYVLKPIARKATRVQPLMVTAIVGASALVLLLAVLMRGLGDHRWVLVVGAIALAPPLAAGGYSFLRNDELEPYTGSALVIRTAICSAVYAGTWGVYTYLYFRLLGDAPVETWSVLPFACGFLSLGAATAYVCYDLDWLSGLFHYSLYLLVTILLRLVMGLPAV
ncbi:MAG: hypothetical protein A2W31_17730 [Planctomycetes bacterium RBG_16_64_10]|nr:MAG: hypothetical protein A2W31_17730 [Planctomycetes bacterium RBG_16_64_10]